MEIFKEIFIYATMGCIITASLLYIIHFLKAWNDTYNFRKSVAEKLENINFYTVRNNNYLRVLSDRSNLKYVSQPIEIAGRMQSLKSERDKRIAEFLLSYTQTDTKEVYSNGTVYVPMFRVLDALANDGKEYGLI